MKYNLTFWQRVECFFLWFYWRASKHPDKKTWHEVKKGMEKHKHNYTIPFEVQGYKFLRCDHEGCWVCHKSGFDE